MANPVNIRLPLSLYHGAAIEEAFPLLPAACEATLEYRPDAILVHAVCADAETELQIWQFLQHALEASLS